MHNIYLSKDLFCAHQYGKYVCVIYANFNGFESMYFYIN